MVKMSVVYEGDLRCRLTHGPSGSQILTDAPVDNNGQGRNFSPTDLAAASLGSCILTVMGIAAQKNGIVLDGAKIELEKEMVVVPVRRIGRITVKIDMPAGIPSSRREALEQIGHNCPVHKSFGDDVTIEISFQYPD